MTVLIVQTLIGMRAEIVQGRVATPAIIECFDIKEKVSSSLVAGLINTVMHALAFQSTEKALHWSVVIPASDAVHTDLDTVVL